MTDRSPLIVAPSVEPDAGMHAAAVADRGQCLNCDASLTGPYCSACGQAVRDPRPTVREFAHETAAELLGWDGKLARTFATMLRSPGRLTQEYLRGRRASYLSPLRLYLACSVVFFLVAAVTPDAPPQVVKGKVTAGPATIFMSSMLEMQVAARPGRPTGYLRRRWIRGQERARADREGYRAAVSATLPRVAFVMVPLYALLVGLAFRRRGVRYPQHLAFTLHVAAFGFLLMSTPMLLAPAVAARVVPVLQLVGALGTVAYAAMAARRVYERGVVSSLLRITLLVCSLPFVLGAIGALGAWIAIITF